VLVRLPHWEFDTLEGADRRFEGSGNPQAILVGLLLQIDGPAKALADVVPRLVITFGAGVPFLVGRDEDMGWLVRRREQSKEGYSMSVSRGL
jgi:hypothetical protein